MTYEIRLEKAFVKRMNNLSLLFGLTRRQTNEVRETIVDAIEFLANGKALPEYFFDHVLQREPWNGYRVVTITSHQELATGKLQD